jgi:hypothetical protein
MQEQHYSLKQLAGLWNLSTDTIRNLIRHEPGVLRLEGLGPSVGKRSYTTYSIPDSVATRIHQRLTQQPLQPILSGRHPRRVEFLRNRNRRVSK